MAIVLMLMVSKLTKKIKPHKFTKEQIENIKIARKGSGNSNATLTEEKVLEIRKLFFEGIDSLRQKRKDCQDQH